MTLAEIIAAHPEWTRRTQIEAWLSDLRREVGEETMNDAINRCFNSTGSEVDEDGSVWICDPQTGHWAGVSQLESLVGFFQAQG